MYIFRDPINVSAPGALRSLIRHWLRRTARFMKMMKRMNAVQKINCRAKEAGRFVKLYLNSSDDHPTVTSQLTAQKQTYFVISDRDVKPTKIVINGLPTDTKYGEIRN